MNIEKAPIYKPKLGEYDYYPYESQRDADHPYYLQQFVKWLKENTNTCDEFKNVRCLPIKAFEALFKEAEK